MAIPPAFKTGSANDVLLFLNEVRPPNATRDAQGRVVFREGRASACVAIQWTGGPDVSAAVQAVLERHGATRVINDVGDTICPDDQRSYDIVAVERRLFQALTPENLRSLLIDIAERRLVLLEPGVTAADIAAARGRQQRQLEITAGLRNGTLQGMGLLQLGTNLGRICAVGIREEDRPTAMDAVQGWRDKLPPRLAAVPPDLVVFDISAVLSAARGGECGAIFGDAASLREIEAALSRDRLPVVPALVWMTPPEWLALRERYQGGAALERRRVLRARVNPLGERLIGDLQAYIDGRPTSVGVEFPAFAQWFSQVKAANWGLAVERFEIEDFGEATWSRGSLPAVSVFVHFKLTAASASGSETNCLLFVWLDDSGAGARRDPTAVRCGSGNDIERWKSQRGMRSTWN